MKDSSFGGHLYDLHAYEYFIHHHLQFIAVSCLCIGILLLIFSAHWSPICSFLYSAWGCYAGRNCMVPSFERLISERIRIFFHSSDQSYKQKLFWCAIWNCSNICHVRGPQELLTGFGGSLWKDPYPAGSSLSSLKHGGQAHLLNITPRHLLGTSAKGYRRRGRQEMPHGILTGPCA